MNVIYTYTDEAPALATHSFLPVIEAFAGRAGVDVELRDISLAGRILAQFTDQPDALAELGELAKTPEANIIKLPNISASIPQLKAAIKELQDAGFDVPDYPDDAQTPRTARRGAYDAVKGSAVNPVLREGNSDRRAPASVKAFARKHPHSMGAWSKESKTHVSTMGDGDFRSTERSVTIDAADELRIEHVARRRHVTRSRRRSPVQRGRDRRRRRDAPRARWTRSSSEQVADASEQGVLFSVHLKATMMKVSDPIIFGHAVRAYFADVFAAFADDLASVGASPNNGLASILTALEKLPAEKRSAIEAAIEAAYATGPRIAMVDSDRGITNLHVPSDVIIDASMPAMIRTSGQMWNADGEPAGHQGRDPGLELRGAVRGDDRLLPRARRLRPGDDGHDAERRPDGAEGGGVRLATTRRSRSRPPGTRAHRRRRRARSCSSTTSRRATSGAAARRRTRRSPTGCGSRSSARGRRARRPCSGSTRPARTTPRSSRRCATSSPSTTSSGLQIEILPVAEATRFTLERAAAGEDTISVTGNVLRDYLTDLFPILELGTSAKMLSIVPLMNGGGLFETGAGGSAPKHVQQLVRENHLRWDSLGEFLALAVSFEMLAEKTGNARAACSRRRSTPRPARCSRTAGRRRARRASSTTAARHFYLALYWAQALAAQTEDEELRERSRRSPSGSRPRRTRSWPSSTACRASRSSSAATTSSTATRRPP